MHLPINQSLRQIGPHSWLIGSKVCERIKHTQLEPANTIIIWEEDDALSIIRDENDGGESPASSPGSSAAGRPQSNSMKGSDNVELVHEGGSLSAVWSIGKHAFCKVHPWEPAMEDESETIAFVKRIAPEINTPEVILTWTNSDLCFNDLFVGNESVCRSCI